MPRLDRKRGVIHAEWHPAKRGPSGKRLCKRCLVEVPPRRLSWCSKECADAQLLALNPRWRVSKRDNGICALCAVDTKVVENEVTDLARILSSRWDRVSPEERTRAEKRAEELIKAGWRSWRHWGPQLSQWEADHIVPIVEGGGFTMENLRTLCVPCHKRETAALAARRAKARRANA